MLCRERSQNDTRITRHLPARALWVTHVGLSFLWVCPSSLGVLLLVILIVCLLMGAGDGKEDP